MKDCTKQLLLFKGISNKKIEVFDFCEGNNMKYVLGLRLLSPLVQNVKPLVKEASVRFDLGKQPVRMFTEILYKAKSWKKRRRVIAKVEYNALGSNTRFIITNLEHWNR